MTPKERLFRLSEEAIRTVIERAELKVRYEGREGIWLGGLIRYQDGTVSECRDEHIEFIYLPEQRFEYVTAQPEPEPEFD